MTPARKIKRKIIRLFFREQWSILVCDPDGVPLKELVPPGDRIWADPFPVFHEGKLFLFVEEQVTGGDGILGCMEIHDDLSHGPLIPILEADYHLSWPNVFPVIKNGQTVWYLVPESNSSGAVECYRAKKFPYEWEHDSTLIPGIRAVDPEIVHIDNSWFLFASVKYGKYGMNDSLSVYHSTAFPSGKWTQLPENPVITGREKSRMAGRIYRDDNGLLVRPAQYSKSDYGQRVVLNRIETLSPVEYRETPLNTVYPEKKLGAVCTHTWNPCGQYVFRDIKKRFFDPLWRLKKGTDT